MLMSEAVDWLKNGVSDWGICKNFTHWAKAKCDCSNNNRYRIIPDAAAQQRATILLWFIGKIPFWQRRRNVNLHKLRLHYSNHFVPSFHNVSCLFQVAQNQQRQYIGALFEYMVNIIFNITNCETQWPDIVITRTFGQVILIGCNNEWHSGLFYKKFIPCISLPLTGVHLSVDFKTVIVSRPSQFKIINCQQ